MNTLEDILQVLGSKKPFLAECEIDTEGHKQPFTKSGSKAYSKLTEILYCIENITGTNMNNVIEELDSIATNDI